MADGYALSVVCPCLNEEANLPLLAERLFAATKEAGIATELVVVDDGSTDGTARVAEDLRLEYGDAVQCVRHEHNRGIPASWKSGLDVARGTYACFIDGDLQNPPEEVVTLYLRLRETAYDLAQGTRSSIGRLRDSRLLFSRVLNGLLNAHVRDGGEGQQVGVRARPQAGARRRDPPHEEVPALSDVHLGRRAREGLFGSRGRDVVRESLRGDVVPERQLDAGERAGARRLRPRDRGVPVAVAASPEQAGAVGRGPLDERASVSGVAAAVVRGVLRDDAAAPLVDPWLRA